MESMESGTHTFLIDEDTSATNFMIRDELMQRVVLREKEPITPFIERVRYLYETCGISTVIVAGSSGSYFQVADHVIQMDQYVPYEITETAKEAAADYPSITLPDAPADKPSFHRVMRPVSMSGDRGRTKMKTLSKDAFSINRDTVDLRYVEQLMDSEQTTALSYCLLYAESHLINGKATLQEVVENLMELLEKKGLFEIMESTYAKSNLAMPRKQEIFACLNRYRKL